MEAINFSCRNFRSSRLGGFGDVYLGMDPTKIKLEHLSTDPLILQSELEVYD